MQIHEETLKFYVLTASEGHKLTQTADVELMERRTPGKITSTAELNPADWKEIPLEEAQAIRAAQEELRLQEHEAIQAEISNNKSEQGI